MKFRFLVPALVEAVPPHRLTLSPIVQETTVVIHKQIYRRGPFGGVLNTTLCGRLHAGQEHNCTEKDSEVTCKFCLAKLQALRKPQA